jgi:hypothetical protein
MTRNRPDAASDDPEGRRPARGDTPAPSDAEVAAYLRRNPDFLARHSELLDVLEPPARQEGEGVVDLQQFMLDRLRGEVARLRDQQNDLIQTGRANLASTGRVHEAVLAILRAASFEHLIETVVTDLSVILDLDAVTICVEQAEDGPSPSRVRGVHQMEPGTVAAVLDTRSYAFLSDIRGEPELFGSAAGLVRSAALLRLRISSATPPALLALGARNPEHFDPGQGSELLLFLSQALALTIRQWLELPE